MSPLCGAKTKTGFCRRPVKREGLRCIKHRGNQGHVTSGRYSTYLPTDTAERYQELLEETRGLREERVLLQWLLELNLEQFQKSAISLEQVSARALPFVKQIVEVVMAEHKIEMDQARAFSLTEMNVFMTVLASIINRQVPDPKVRRAIGTEMRLLLEGRKAGLQGGVSQYDEEDDVVTVVQRALPQGD